MTDRERDRQRTRRVFEESEAGVEPRMERLMQALPDMLAKARRHEQRPDDFWSALVPLARVAIPRFATVSLVLALVSTGLFLFNKPSQTTTTSSSYALEQWILDGTISDDSGLTTEGILGLGPDDG